MKQTAFYVRVSHKDRSVEQQLTALRQYAAYKGLQNVVEYPEDVISGAKDSRPALNRLMAACRRGEVDTVLVVKIDRWGRSMKHLVESIQELTALGVAFVEWIKVLIPASTLLWADCC
jgi:DNA invertase Pin-like site-specific DNA recombinase